MHDIFSTNTTKLSLDEGMHVEPGFRLSTGIAEAMLELQEMDIQLFKEMLAHDYKEIELRQKGFNESALEALHEGMWDTIKQKVSAMWDWFVKKITSIWELISSFVNKVLDSVLELVSSLFGTKWDDKEEENDKTIAPKEKKNRFDVKITWFKRFDPKFAVDMLYKIKPFQDYTGWFGRNGYHKGMEKDMLNQTTVPMRKIYKEFQNSDLFETIEISAKDVKELNSVRAIRSTALMIKPLAKKSKDYCKTLTSGKDKVLQFIERNNEILSLGVPQALRMYMNNFLEITQKMRNYFNTICKALYKIQSHIKHTVVSKNDMPELVEEMVEWDFEQVFESCYIDNTGTAVCNF